MDALRKDDLERARNTAPGEKLRQALELMQLGIDLRRRRLRAADPTACDQEIDARLLAPMADPEDVKGILYQHSVLCQTCMPYRDPGNDIRIWKRRNGIVRMELQAGRALDPNIDDFVDVGLPWAVNIGVDKCLLAVAGRLGAC